MQPRASIIGSGLSSPIGSVISPNRQPRASIMQPQMIHSV